MNYAALIALLAALAFALPFLVSLAENAGVPRGFSMMTSFAAAVFALAYIVIRSRVIRRQALEERVAEIQQQRTVNPNDLEAFLLHGDHLGDLLLTLGRQREALDAFEAYRQLAKQLGSEKRLAAIERAIVRLRTELGIE